jgi:hypothetical protein
MASSHGCVAMTATKEEVAALMPYQTLGRTGLRVSRLSFGAWVTFGRWATGQTPTRKAHGPGHSLPALTHGAQGFRWTPCRPTCS